MSAIYYEAMWPYSNPTFPSVESASPDGLLLLGGELTPKWLLEAYGRGIFPWPIQIGWSHQLAWFSPDPRGVLELDALHISRRLARRLRRSVYRATINQAFKDVIRECAVPRKAEDGTWITPELCAAFCKLHTMGVAHSVEVWDDQQLVGGLYGVAIGGYFSAESMFSHRTDASKIALATLMERLRARRFEMCDIQVLTPHLERLGATAIPRADFQQRLRPTQKVSTSFA